MASSKWCCKFDDIQRYFDGDGDTVVSDVVQAGEGGGVVTYRQVGQCVKGSKNSSMVMGSVTTSWARYVCMCVYKQKIFN